MPIAELTLANPDILLAVRSFSIEDGLSQLFSVELMASSPSPDLDLEAIVGLGASLRLARADDDEAPYAVWSGVCSDIEQVAVEDKGASLYCLRIVPMLWRCTQRCNHRVFQHLTVPNLVDGLLEEWGIDTDLRLDPQRYSPHEYRVQFGETDFDFVSRLLEEEGLSYGFEQVAPKGDNKEDHELPLMSLVLSDKPGETGSHIEQPVAYIGNTDDVTGRMWVSKVRLGRAARAGRYTLAGYDYRSSPDLRLLASAAVGGEIEQRLERFHYQPRAFLAEPRPDTEKKKERGTPEPPVNRADEKRGEEAASIGLERERSRQRRVNFATNHLGLAPGVVFQLDGHPRAELCAEQGLLVVTRRIEGHIDGEWTIGAAATLVGDPFRPPLKTPKPRVMGLQSAIVVGPEGEEIHTEPLGRVRVQFHWDRYGQSDENSSCWIRVSQGWAGSGYGMSAIPRIGHEVLVDFFEGDPDRPVIVGRAYNRGASPPDTLPQQRTVTSWKSNSSPGGEGHNEISMEDARGEELLYLRAQRNLKTMVLADEEESVGGALSTTVRRDEQRSVGGSQTIKVAGDRVIDVDGRLSTSARNLQAQAGEVTGMSCSDGKLVLTNGSASIVLDGPNLFIEAAANLRVSAGREAALYGQQVTIDGRPDVYINSGSYEAPEPKQLPPPCRIGEGGMVVRRERERDRPAVRDGRPVKPRGIDEARFNGKEYLLQLVNRNFGTKLKLPKWIKLPPEMDEQLERYGRIAYKGEIVKNRLMDPDTYQDMKDRFERRIEAEKQRIQKIGDDIYQTFDHQRDHYSDLAGRLKERASVEKDNLAKLKTDLGAIFSGEKGNFKESCKALVEVFKEQGKHIKKLRKDVKAMIDREMAYFKRFKQEWVDIYEEVNGVVEDIKELIDNPKDALLDIILGPDKEMAHELADLAEEFGWGDEVNDFFNIGGEEGSGGGGMPDVPNRPPDTPKPGGISHRMRAGKGPKREMQLKEGSRFGKKPPQQNVPQVQTGKGQLSAKPDARGMKPDKGKVSTKPGGLGVKGHGKISSKPMGDGVMPEGIQSDGMVERSGMAAAASGGPSAGGVTAGEGYGGDVFARPGGLAANDFGNNIAPQQGPAFLQSPGQGQLMVLPDSGAQAVDSAKLSGAMVDAQMQGKPVNGAISDSLGKQGYSVYTRDWGDWSGPFKAAADKAATKG